MLTAKVCLPGGVNEAVMGVFSCLGVNHLRRAAKPDAVNHHNIVAYGCWQSSALSAKYFAGTSCGWKIAPQIAAKRSAEKKTV
jgi:hypothetical protein